MTNKAVVQFGEFQVSLETLRKLPSEHVAALAAFGFCITELNAIRRIYLAQPNETTDNKVIEQLQNSQQLVVIRTWSSKLFEAYQFLESLCGKKPVTRDPLLQQLASDALKDLGKLSSSEGYQTARDIRNEISNHYLFSVALKNFPHVHSDALCNIYSHDYSGNDFFPLGESVMFHGRLHRKWKDMASLSDRMREFHLWLDWCQRAHRSLELSHASFIGRLLFDPLRRRKLVQKTYYVSPSLVGYPLDHKIPLIFRKSPSP